MIIKNQPFPIDFKICKGCNKERAISTFDKNDRCIFCRGEVYP